MLADGGVRTKPVAGGALLLSSGWPSVRRREGVNPPPSSCIRPLRWWLVMCGACHSLRIGPPLVLRVLLLLSGMVALAMLVEWMLLMVRGSAEISQSVALGS